MRWKGIKLRFEISVVPMEGPGWCCMTLEEEAEIIDLLQAIHAEAENKARQLHLLKEAV